MISTAQIRFLSSLKIKKYRQKNNAFVGEGEKVASELLGSGMAILNVFAISDWVEMNDNLLNGINDKVNEVTDKELKKASFLKTPNKVIVVAEIPKPEISKIHKEAFTIVLDNMSDPGNMGTIIRIADWFGINDIVCSSSCVDAYNPKVVQGTMGSIARVNLHYTDLEAFFLKYKGIKVYGAIMQGRALQEYSSADPGFILIGGESDGIDPGLDKFITDPVTIPGSGSAESLNAAVATGIVVHHLTMNKEQ
ncbi:MAG: RNA methyltransferase [candidate division Zixibacteria bacterium]|nr:RNA methyltransferase [candidate division Zixibacteria bacterium]